MALEDPTTILYRSPRPILTPEAPQEIQGLIPHVVFPTATDLRADGRLDVYYGAADSVIGAARMSIPAQLPVLAEVPLRTIEGRMRPEEGDRDTNSHNDA